MIDLDWAAYLAQLDPVYEMPARCWQDGLPLGNGSLGAMAYEPFHPEWVINKNGVWDYRHPELTRHSMEEVRRFTAEAAQSEANIAHILDVEIRHDKAPEPLKAVEVLNGRLQESTTESLDHRDTLCPALEGPGLYLLLVGEMLLQSQNGIVRLFPALPSERDATFADLRARGPLLASAQRVDGVVTFVHLKALAPVACRLRNPWPEQSCPRRFLSPPAETERHRL